MTRFTTPALVAFAVALGALAFSPQTGAQDAGPAKIGFVDLGVLFADYARKAELEQEINEVREGMKARVARWHQQLKGMRETARGLAKGTQEHDEAVLKIKQAEHAFQLQKEHLEKTLKRRVEANTLSILEDLHRTIDRYAKEQAYTAVFKVDTKSRADRFQDQIFREQVASVAYYDADRVGITAEVLKLLNSPAQREWLEKKRQGKF